MDCIWAGERHSIGDGTRHCTWCGWDAKEARAMERDRMACRTPAAVGARALMDAGSIRRNQRPLCGWSRHAIRERIAIARATRSS